MPWRPQSGANPRSPARAWPDAAMQVPALGSPIDRTSVDHGTAFDIAGTGKADHANMLAAIAYAEKLAGLAG